MKSLLSAALLLVAIATPVNPNAIHCPGELYPTTPPVPNNPTHVRNIAWRNAQSLRESCQSQTIHLFNRETARSNQTKPLIK